MTRAVLLERAMASGRTQRTAASHWIRADGGEVEDTDIGTVTTVADDGSDGIASLMSQPPPSIPRTSEHSTHASTGVASPFNGPACAGIRRSV